MKIKRPTETHYNVRWMFNPITKIVRKKTMDCLSSSYYNNGMIYAYIICPDRTFIISHWQKHIRKSKPREFSEDDLILFGLHHNIEIVQEMGMANMHPINLRYCIYNSSKGSLIWLK